MRDVRSAAGGGSQEEGATQRVTVKIFGEEYVLRGDAKPAYMERLADMVDRRMNEIAKRHPRLGITRIAVLTAINLADELSKLEEQYQRVLGMLEREWDRRKRELNGRLHQAQGPAAPAEPVNGEAGLAARPGAAGGTGTPAGPGTGAGAGGPWPATFPGGAGAGRPPGSSMPAVPPEGGPPASSGDAR